MRGGKEAIQVGDAVEVLSVDRYAGTRAVVSRCLRRGLVVIRSDQYIDYGTRRHTPGWECLQFTMDMKKLPPEQAAPVASRIAEEDRREQTCCRGYW
jgi:hypothetical protein